MRLVAGVLSLALFAPIARAEDTATPPAPAPGSPAAPIPASPPPAAPAANHGGWIRVPFRVVRVMPETRQALLFDRIRNTHVLAEVGGTLDGYTIEDIDDETVSLRRDNQQVVLAAPPHGSPRARELPPVRLRSATAVPVSDAAAPGAGGPPAPIDPYGDLARPADGLAAQPPAVPVAAPDDALPPEPGIRVAHAPASAAPPGSAPVIVPGEGGVRVAAAPDVGPAAGPATAPGAPGPAPSLAPPAAALPASPGGIRVVSAAPGAAPPPSPPPAAPSAPPTTPGAALAAPGAVPAAPAEPDPAAVRTAAIEPAEPRPAEIREVRAADTARAPDKQTADARALADILASDRPARGPRALAELPAPTRAAEVHPAAVAPPAPAPGDAIAISRGDLDSALADFARLTAGVRGSFSATGVAIDSVGDGTIFQRAGLRAGDVITSVDGVRLRTLDDAANLYARASTARAVTAQVVRAGKPVTLHVVIQ